jgi:hypothetical protein
MTDMFFLAVNSDIKYNIHKSPAPEHRIETNMIEQLVSPTLDDFAWRAGRTPMTIVGSGNYIAWKRYVRSMIRSIEQLNTKNPDLVRSVFGGPLQTVVIDFPDEPNTAKAMGEVQARYMMESMTKKVIFVTNRWGDSSFPFTIMGVSKSKNHERYVHQVYADYDDLTNAMNHGGATTPQEQVAWRNMHESWDEIVHSEFEVGDSYERIIVDPIIHRRNTFIKNCMEANLRLLVNTMAEVKTATINRDISELVAVYPGLRELLLLEQKFLANWKGSATNISETWKNLRATQEKVWEIWGEDKEIILKNLALGSTHKENIQKLTETLSNAQMLREKTLAASKENLQASLCAWKQALQEVTTTAEQTLNTTDNISTELKDKEAPISRLFMKENGKTRDEKEQEVLECTHQIALDVEIYVQNLGNTAAAAAHKALRIAEHEVEYISNFPKNVI